MNASFFGKPINAPLILFCISCVALTGCGGGSSGNSADKTPGASGTILRSSPAATPAVEEVTSSAASNTSSTISQAQESSATGIINKKDTVSPTAPDSISKVILNPQNV